MAATQLDDHGRARADHLGPERRRPLILDVAFELFLAHGYRGTSMDAIARAAGVTKPVVYACFASKAELFGALLGREEHRMLSQFTAAVADGVGLDDPEAALAAGFTAMLRAVSDTPDVYRVALLGGGEGAVAIDARVRHGREHRVAAVAAATRAWLDGRTPPSRLDATARLLGQMLVTVGEAGTRTLLAAPAEWTPESLGRVLGRFAAGGCAALLAAVSD
jgi:AcrR family transcriptional regulator